MSDYRPYRVYRTSIVGLVLYDTQQTREGAESSICTGQVEHPNATFSIEFRERTEAVTEDGELPKVSCASHYS